MELSIPNGCFDAYEVKVNKGIFKYQEKAKLYNQVRSLSHLATSKSVAIFI